MKLSPLLKSATVIPNFEAPDKDSALEKLVELIMPCLNSQCPVDAATVVQALKAREAITSTGIGNGVAIPHAKIEGLKEMLLLIARAPKGIDFQALDGETVNLIFLVIAPPEAVSQYLGLLSAISLLVKNDQVRSKLLAANTKADIIAALKAGERNRH